MISFVVSEICALSKHLPFVAIKVFVMAHEVHENHIMVAIFFGHGLYAANPPMAVM